MKSFLRIAANISRTLNAPNSLCCSKSGRQRLPACTGAKFGSSLHQVSRPVPPLARRAALTSQSGCFSVWRKSGSRPPETIWATSESWSQSSSTCLTSCSTPTTSSWVRLAVPALCISASGRWIEFPQWWIAWGDKIFFLSKVSPWLLNVV